MSVRPRAWPGWIAGPTVVAALALASPAWAQTTTTTGSSRPTSTTIAGLVPPWETTPPTTAPVVTAPTTLPPVPTTSGQPPPLPPTTRAPVSGTPATSAPASTAGPGTTIAPEPVSSDSGASSGMLLAVALGVAIVVSATAIPIVRRRRSA